MTKIKDVFDSTTPVELDPDVFEYFQKFQDAILNGKTDEARKIFTMLKQNHPEALNQIIREDPSFMENIQRLNKRQQQTILDKLNPLQAEK